MLRKSLLATMLGGCGNVLLLFLASMFGVTWGAPKPAWVHAAMWLASHPLELDYTSRYFIWTTACNGAVSAGGLLLLSYGLRTGLTRIRPVS